MIYYGETKMPWAIKKFTLKRTTAPFLFGIYTDCIWFVFVIDMFFINRGLFLSSTNENDYRTKFVACCFKPLWEGTLSLIFLFDVSSLFNNCHKFPIPNSLEISHGWTSRNFVNLSFTHRIMQSSDRRFYAWYDFLPRMLINVKSYFYIEQACVVLLELFNKEMKFPNHLAVMKVCFKNNTKIKNMLLYTKIFFQFNV